jgi:hypothetical protein
MSYKGISLVDQIYLGAYESIELDIYAYVACYKMFEWIKCLVIKFKLVWMDMFMRLLLISGLNGYMSCESIQTSWFQVWFNLKKNSSNDEICPLLKIWVSWVQVLVWVIKSYWIGLKFGIHALHL